MSWAITKHLRSICESEIGHCQSDWGGKIPIALIYPNTYDIGMGNLAIHHIYHRINQCPNFICERFFLPDPMLLAIYQKTNTPLLSIESQRPLSDFSCALFSISFENDFLNIIPILNLATIPTQANQRNHFHPLILAGGAACMVNPRPIAKYMDAIFFSEWEAIESHTLDIVMQSQSKSEQINQLSSMEGLYIPELHQSLNFDHRQSIQHLDEHPTQTRILTQNAQFSDMHLIEVQRGCPHVCQFCVTPHIYKPLRQRSFEAIKGMIDYGKKYRQRMGLIGADLFHHPEFDQIADYIHAQKCTFSPSSIRVDALSEHKLKLLNQSGHQNIALGIEAATDTLRQTLKKRLSNDTIMQVVASCAKHHITSLRLYMMIGLPNETMDDITAIMTLAADIYNCIEKHAPSTARNITVSITLSPFIPKTHTPLHNSPFQSDRYFKTALKTLRQLIPHPGISIHMDSILQAKAEAILANGDENTANFIDMVHVNGLRHALRHWPSQV